MSTNIVETIQSRLELMGMSQAQLAENSSATPSQMSIFLRGKGTLSTESLNKVLDILGIDLSIYTKRNNLAREVAEFLKSKHVESIDNWTKDDLANFTRKKEILLFFDINTKEDFLYMVESGVVDIESSYPYFKALTQYYMSIGGNNPTASQAKQAIEDMTKNIDEKELTGSDVVLLTALAAAGIIVAPLLTSVAVGAYVGSTMFSKQVGAVSLFSKTISSSLLKKALSYYSEE